MKRRTCGASTGLLLLGLGSAVVCAQDDAAPSTTRQNEHRALASLVAIYSAQFTFRNHDADGDGRYVYGTLAQLGAAGLVDEALARGVREGYRFDAHPSAATPEFLWMATATPTEPGVTGTRHFMIDLRGRSFSSTRGPFPTTDDGQAPPGSAPLGRPEVPQPPREAPSLAGVAAGQRYVYWLAQDRLEVWTVTEVATARVAYEVVPVTKLRGKWVEGAPIASVWTPSVGLDDSTELPRVAVRRDRRTVSGITFACEVVNSNLLVTWYALEGDAPTFPPVLRQVDPLGLVLRELREVREPGR